MQKIRKKLTETWVEFGSFISTTVNKKDKYRISNLGNSTALLLETDSAPSASSVDGDPLYYKERATFTKPASSTLYMRSVNGETFLNIVKVD